MYKPIKNIILRFPHYPVDVIKRALTDKHFFVETVGSADFREAIYFSSPILYEELTKYINGGLNDKDRLRIRNSLIKYLSRMSTRCTPFASLASCATAELSDQQEIVISGKEKKSMRFDMLYLCNLLQAVQDDENIASKLKYKANPTFYPLGNKYRYITFNNGKNGRIYKIVELDKSSLLSFVLKKSKCYISLQDLKKEIQSIYEITDETVDEYLKKLIAAQILTSELDPFILGADLFSTMLHKIRDIDYSVFSKLENLHKNIVDLNSEDSFERRIALCSQIETELKNLKVPYVKKFIFQQDSVRVLEKASISESIIGQLTGCIEFLNKITPYYSNNLIERFKRRFTERYDEQEIPLLEALDPDIGIGYGIEHDRIYHPLINDLFLPSGTTGNSMYSVTPLYTVLLNKLVSYDDSKDTSIELTDDDVKELNVNWSDLPVTLAASFKILAFDAETKKYLLGDLYFSGCSAANLLGRFAYCDAGINHIVNEIAGYEQKVLPNEIVAEISHIPNARTGNILSRTLIRDYEISYLTNSAREEKNIIYPNDMNVSVKNGKIRLKSKSLNKYIIPRLTTAHNYNNGTTPLYRFLCDLQSQGLRSSLYFSWGELSNRFEHLPRVIYKNIILSAASWRIRKGDINKKDIKKTDIHVIREKYHLPRYINLVEGDNKLFVDLDNELSVNTFIGELSGKSIIFLEEFIECGDVSADTSSKRYMNECIIPFIKV